MDIEKLIENAKVCCGDIETEDCSQYCIDPRDSRDSGLRWCRQWLIHDLHTALSTLQAENKRLNKIVCSIPTTPDSGRTVSQYDKEMSICVYLDDLEAENEKLRAELNDLKAKWEKYQPKEHWETLDELCKNLHDELDKVTAERDAAIADIAAILAEVEEIRRGYGVDNADADNAFADLCGNYCAKNGNACYKEAEDYRCKNFMWRGIKED